MANQSGPAFIGPYSAVFLLLLLFGYLIWIHSRDEKPKKPEAAATEVSNRYQAPIYTTGPTPARVPMR